MSLRHEQFQITGATFTNNRKVYNKKNYWALYIHRYLFSLFVETNNFCYTPSILRIEKIQVKEMSSDKYAIHKSNKTSSQSLHTTLVQIIAVQKAQ